MCKSEGEGIKGWGRFVVLFEVEKVVDAKLGMVYSSGYERFYLLLDRGRGI